MPPKAVRGGRGTGRGRGRGRGRGAAPAEDTPVPPSGTGRGQAIEAEPSQAEVEDAPMPDAPEPATTTPQPQDDSFSPNSSPATVPTETPAPTPARSRVPSKVDSAEASSSQVGPSSTSTRGGRGGAKPPAAPSRFKPKNVRSDATKLEELAKKEQQRLNSIAAAKAREESKLLRGRGRPARGRGDAMGRPAARGGGSGLFGMMPEALKKTPAGFIAPTSAGGGGSSSSGGFAAKQGVKHESGGISRSGGSGGGYGGGSGGGGGGGGQYSADYNFEPEYPNQDEGAPRVDIETINLVSDDESESIPGYNKGGGMKPVRLHRHEHKERVTIVNTVSAVKPAPADEGPIDVDELPATAVLPKHRDSKTGVRDEVQVKFEPVDPSASDSVMEAGSVSPQAKRKVLAGTEASSAIINGGGDDGPSIVVPAPVSPRKARRASSKRDKKPVLQTEEDKAEYQRHLEDIEILAKELGGMQGNLTDRQRKDANGDIIMDDTADSRRGRLYLFQFPPVLPELYDPAKGKPQPALDLKTQAEKDKADKEKEKDVEMGGTSSSAKGKGKAPDRIDLIGESPAIKTEETAILADQIKKDEEPEKRAPYVHEEGYIGKLIVRESGRVELSWGGVNLLVSRGVGTSFLSTGVVVDGVMTGPPGGGVPEGKALSMGQIMGKFVVTPNWEHMS